MPVYSPGYAGYSFSLSRLRLSRSGARFHAEVTYTRPKTVTRLGTNQA